MMTAEVESLAEVTPGEGPRFPRTSNEFVTVMAHYHRAEIARMAGWRDRLDRTTNWAITVVGAMLSVSLSTGKPQPGLVLLAMCLVTLLLLIESRRYRFFDVYRARVRLLETNWFAPIFSSACKADVAWLGNLADHLRKPVFRIGAMEALSRRLRRNYGWLFLVLFVVWTSETATTLRPDGGVDIVASYGEWFENARFGPLPGPITIIVVATFYVSLMLAALSKLGRQNEFGRDNVHV